MSNPLWGGASSSGGFGSGASGGGFNQDGWLGLGQVQHPRPFAGGSDAPNTGATPGTYSINPADPAGSAQNVAEETQGLFHGLKVALFGSDNVDSQGQHGGLLGGVPIIGDIGRFGTGVVAAGGDAVLAGVGGALERIPATGPNQALEQQFAALPDTSQAKQDALKAMDQGLFGTGVLSNRDHLMSQALRGYAKEQNLEHPDLYRGLIVMPGSVADTVTNLFGLMGMGQRTVERAIAGAGKPGAGGMNRLQEVLAVGRGDYAFGGLGGSAEMTPVEQMVYQKVTAGEWTESEALDFMASNGAGLSHAQWLQVAGAFATDPLTVGSLGAAGLAKAGVTGAKLIENLRAGEAALQAAQASGDVARITEATQALQQARAATVAASGSTARLNVIGKLAESPTASAFLRDTVGRGYSALEGNAIGRMARITRNIIDPFQAFSHGQAAAQTVDLMSEVTSKAGVLAYGAKNHLGVLETLHDVHPELYSQVVDNLAVYFGNVARRVVGTQHRAAILARGLDSLAATIPDDVIEHLVHNAPKSYLDLVTEEVQRFRIQNWDEEALANLSNRMERFYGVKSADEWRGVLDGMNADQRSLLHASTYGRATQRLLDGVATATREGSGMSDKLHRLILLNRDTLTKLGADGIIERIAKAASLDEAEAELIAAQKQYPELRYFTYERALGQRSIDRFVSYLQRRLESLPMQVTREEAATLHPSLQTLADDIEGAYTLGFSPADEFKWGLGRVNVEGGEMAPIGDVWPDHVGVADVGPGYRAGRYLQLNFRGQPVLEHVGRVVTKPVDMLDVMGRTMKARVSGTIIADAARSKFIAKAVDRHGMTEGEAKAIIDRLHEMTGETSTVANPRGLSAGNMWRGSVDLVPKRLIGQMTQRDLLKLVLDAYDGDIRFIGATQKLTSRAKAVLGNASGVNFLGQISEHLYPLIKFRLNAIFQLQEKIEPWVLNAQRGAQVAIGTKMSAADVITQRSLENMVKHSLVRMGDVDQIEYSAAVLHGTQAERVYTRVGGPLRRFLDGVTDVQGVKRINMLRTFRKGLGSELKGVWETHSPGLWDEMKSEAQLRAGHLINDDDFAVQVMGEHLLGNDVVVRRIEQGGKADFLVDYKASIAPGQWAVPSHIGELKPLELDTMAELLGFTAKGGKALKTQGDLRAALAAQELEIEDITDALIRHGADPDYVRRVENSLTFSWEGFWQTAQERFNLTVAERRQAEGMIAASAGLRGMTPVDYMSQVFSPVIRGGQEAAVGELGKAVELMRGGKPREVPQLAELAAGARRPPKPLPRVKSVGTAADWSTPVGAASKIDGEWRFNAQRFGIKPKLSGQIEKITGKDSTTYVLRDAEGRPAGYFDFAEPQPGKVGSINLVSVRPDAQRQGVASALYDRAIADGYDIRPASGVTTTTKGKAFADSYWARRDATPGAPSRDDLMRQMAQVFSAHLDPSAKWALLQEFQPELRDQVLKGTVKFDLAELDRMWANGADDKLAQQLMGYMDATEGDYWEANLPRTAEEASAHPMFPDRVQYLYSDAGGGTRLSRTTKFFGDGIWTAPEPLRNELVSATARLRAQFPDIPFVHMDIKDTALFTDNGEKAMAITIGTGRDRGAIILDPKFFGPGYEARWAQYLAATDPLRNVGVIEGAARMSDLGASYTVGRTPVSTIYHEYGHIVDQQIRASATAAGRAAQTARGQKLASEYEKFITDFEGSPAMRALSEYATEHVDEAMGELFDVAFNPEYGDDATRFAQFESKNPQQMGGLFLDDRGFAQGRPPILHGDTGPATVEEAAMELRRILKKMKVWKEPPKAAINPDVIRANRMFGKWSQAAIEQGFLKGQESRFGDLLKQIAGIPTEGAVPYNLTEGRLVQAATDAMVAKWADAYRLQYFAQSRTMLERSINHPLFGIYPASYMWGKLLPEVVRFIARSPFGLRTGAAAYAMHDVIQAVGVQRDLDPDFDKLLEDLGHSQSMWFAGYLLPTVPWDVGASWPTWMRDLAAQGLTSDGNVRAGGNASVPDILRSIQKQGEVINPLRALDQVQSVGREIDKALKPPEPTSAVTKGGFGNTNASVGPVQGANLGPTLEEQMTALREALLAP